jgi:hypothetical protein
MALPGADFLVAFGALAGAFLEAGGGAGSEAVGDAGMAAGSSARGAEVNGNTARERASKGSKGRMELMGT